MLLKFVPIVLVSFLLASAIRRAHRGCLELSSDYQEAGLFKRFVLLVMPNLQIRGLLMLWAVVFGLTASVVVGEYLELKDLPG